MVNKMLNRLPVISRLYLVNDITPHLTIIKLSKHRKSIEVKLNSTKLSLMQPYSHLNSTIENI